MGSEFSFDRPDDETLEVRLAGDWLLATARPSAQDVTREIEARPTKLVRFQAQDVAAWDSGILTFVSAVLAACSARSIQVDRAGLPRGVQRLLALAEAVPEKQGARRDEGRPPWLARVGTRAMTRAKGDLERMAVDPRLVGPVGAAPTLTASSAQLASRP